MIDGRHQVDTEDVVSRQLILVYEVAIVNVRLELAHQPFIHTSIDFPACPLYVPVPFSECVLHEDAERLRDAEVRDI
jgi:hypothetical protein